MKPLITIPLLCSALLSVITCAADSSNATLRVLFLGDRAGHRPAQRFAILEPVLAKRGIEMVYTEAMTNLNSENLARFDCLMVYANVTRISPDQEKALLDFVTGGGGLAPIHCASYCFHNSSNYIELVGGQFSRHETGVIKETILKPDHPIMKGLTPIQSWDETYVHRKHNSNRIVLAERRYPGTNSMAANGGNPGDQDSAEPYTWVREHGNGRMFYTAWGHDQRTWNNAEFQALLERGIRWAAENSPNQKKPRTGLKLDSNPGEAPTPNYVNHPNSTLNQQLNPRSPEVLN
jgi:type 1 glutamine amidotransferase